MVADTQISRRSDRRRSPRYPFDAELEIEWGSATLRGRVRNISSGGLYVALADPLWVGACFAAKVHLAAREKPLLVDCSVRRVEPAQGMGLTFAATEEKSKSRVTSLLGGLAGGSQ